MKTSRKPVKAIILAAGYATRLYPLTLNIPKPLLKIRPDKTVLDFIVDELENSALIEEIIVVTNHKFYADFLRWAKKRKLGRRLSILDDGTLSNADRLGAIGDIYFVVTKKKISSDFVVIGGTTFLTAVSVIFSSCLEMQPCFFNRGV